MPSLVGSEMCIRDRATCFPTQRDLANRKNSNEGQKAATTTTTHHHHHYYHHQRQTTTCATTKRKQSQKKRRKIGKRKKRCPPESELEDEHLAGLGEQDGCLGRDHPHVLVRLHDALDARQGQVVVVLEVLLSTDVEDLHLERERAGRGLSLIHI